MNIDVIDMTDPNVGNDVTTCLNSLGVVSTQLPLYGMSNGLAQMVSSVQEVATEAIQALRIWGHGGPGSQNVTGGAAGNAAQDFAGLNTDNFGQLRPLAPLFHPNGWVELRGCSVGAGAEGAALLLDLAALFNVSVYGATTTQSGSDWEGPVTRATPSGSLSTGVGPDVSGSAPSSGQ
jgi:Domain of unknown function (DUF4347)